MTLADQKATIARTSEAFVNANPSAETVTRAAREVLNDSAERGGGVQMLNVDKIYPGATNKALDNFNLEINPGEMVVLLGGSGCGKSTTLRLLSEGLRPYPGTVRHTGRLGVLPQNPQALFVKKTVREDLFETFDGLHLPPAEQQRLYQYVQENPTPRKIGLLLGVELGLRIGEICGLQWGDFDLKLGTLKINRTVCRISCENGHTKVVIQTPKTRTSRREIPIPKQLLIMLKKLRGCVSNAAWFLSGNESKPTEPRCYRKSIKSYLKQATVRQVRPHALRHTFATTCLQAGCDVKTLSELLGHANANITLQRYVHSDLTRKRREMNRIFSHQVSMRGRNTPNMT